MSKHSDAFKAQLDGFVVLFNDSYRGSGIAVGGYSRDDPARLARRNPTGAIVNVERARQVAREYHDWDIPSEDELRQAAMAGR